MPKVYNKKHNDAPKDAVYIGRPSKWGNPFSWLPNTPEQFKVKDREEAVRAYEYWIINNFHAPLQSVHELIGKDLVCWCKPLSCHGDVLLRLAAELDVPAMEEDFQEYMELSDNDPF